MYNCEDLKLGNSLENIEITNGGAIFHSSLSNRKVICEDGSIKVEIDKRRNDFFNGMCVSANIILLSMFIVFFISGICKIISLSDYKNVELILSICLLNILTPVMIGVPIVVFLILYFLYKYGKRTCEYHGAYHKILGSYMSSKCIPKLEDVKNNSRISEKCRDTKITCMLLSITSIGLLFLFTLVICIDWSMLGFSFFNIFLFLLIFVLFICFNYYIYTNKSKLVAFEYISTSEPKDEQIELLLEGLKIWEDLERNSLPDLSVLEEVNKMRDFSASEKFNVDKRTIKRWKYWYGVLCTEQEDM